MPASASSTKPSSRPRLTGWRRTAARVALAVLAPLVVLGLAELILRLAGFGPSNRFWVKRESGDAFLPNEKFAAQFYAKKSAARPFLYSLPTRKEPGTLRAFILGESAAMGTPDPAFSFSRILEEMLRQRHPNTKFEFVNAAMRGINSHIIRPVASDCAEHAPDLFIVYAGNNEVIGLHAPEPTTWRWTRNLAWLRATQTLKSSRLGHAMRALTQRLRANRGPMEAEPQSQAEFEKVMLLPNDPRRQDVYRNFRGNLEDICQAATRRGARVLLCTVGVNLRDCPPLGSVHRTGLSAADRAAWDAAYARGVKAETDGKIAEAIQAFQAAARIDDQFADLHFRLGRCWAATNTARAREHFELARDWDALQFRADARVNAVIRETATNLQSAGVTLVDAERALAEHPLSDGGVPGAKLFHEHVHPTFAGDYALAQILYRALTNALGERLSRPVTETMPTLEACAQALAFTPMDAYYVDQAMTQLTGRPPFTRQLDHASRQAAAEAALKERAARIGQPEIQQALEIHRAAVQRRPDDWKLRFNLGSHFQRLNQHRAAIEHFEAVVRLFPEVATFRMSLGTSLAEAGQREAALGQFYEARRLEPDNLQAEQAIEAVRKRKAR